MTDGDHSERLIS